MRKKLENKVIISTRPAGQNNELRSLLESEGAKLLEMPTIAIQASKLNKEKTKIIETLEQYNWIAFSSPNGIKYFFEYLTKIKGNNNLPQQLKIAVIGKKSQSVLADYGHEATIVNPGNTSLELATKLMTSIKNTDHILLPEGNLALGTIKNLLALVAKCTSIIVYENKIPNSFDTTIIDKIVSKQYDQIIVTSPSGINNLCTLLDTKLNIHDLKIACIGITTANAVKKIGISSLLTSKTNDSKGIFNEICEYYKSKIN